ncbi:MAG: nicotinate-nucleotide adenylyltransferase [Stenotrophobium sp.]
MACLLYVSRLPFSVSRMKAIGIFGGAFAPFHNGHLRAAIEARERLQLTEVRLIPTAQAPHRRDSHVSPQRRLEWIKLALRREKGLIADDRELLRGGPSFTVDTLTELRQQFAKAPLVLLMGADAFAHLHTWHRWREILDLAHISVISRAGSRLEPVPDSAAELAGRQSARSGDLLDTPAGRWLRLDLPLLDISSTRIRRLLKARQSVRGLLPDAILSHMTAADIAALTQDEDATTH